MRTLAILARRKAMPYGVIIIINIAVVIAMTPFLGTKLASLAPRVAPLITLAPAIATVVIPFPAGSFCEGKGPVKALYITGGGGVGGERG